MTEMEALSKRVTLLERLIDSLAAEIIQTQPPVIQENIATYMRAYYKGKEDLSKVIDDRPTTPHRG